MKELSIEDKAKAYDDLLAKLQKAKVDNDVCDERYCCVIDDIVPELKEGEDERDERIRKALMQNLKERFGTKGNMGKGLDMPDVLAWLEKQGQTFTKKDVDDAYLKGMCDAKQELEKQGAELSVYQNVLFKIATILSQHEDKEDSPLEQIRSIVVDGLLSAMDIEKQGEKKHKVEPIRDGLKTEFQKQVSHLIASVLSEEYDYTIGYVQHVSQALLGYAKNELKLVEWTERDERMYASVVSTIRDVQSSTKREKLQDIHVLEIKWLEELKERNLPQPKQELSEEDEAHIESLLKRLEGICKPGAAFISTRFAISEDEDWLKNLKDRMQSQPKQEWSNWDKTIIESIEALCDEKIESVVYQDVKEHVNDIKKWLKSLKERIQPKQEWSEEDINRFRNLIYLVEHSKEGNGTKRGFIEFINRLKSIKPQATWKPSDEQMEALENVRKILHTNKEIYSKTNRYMFNFEELIRTLKKLREE